GGVEDVGLLRLEDVQLVREVRVEAAVVVPRAVERELTGQECDLWRILEAQRQLARHDRLELLVRAVDDDRIRERAVEGSGVLGAHERAGRVDLQVVARLPAWLELDAFDDR